MILTWVRTPALFRNPFGKNSNLEPMPLHLEYTKWESKYLYLQAIFLLY